MPSLFTPSLTHLIKVSSDVRSPQRQDGQRWRGIIVCPDLCRVRAVRRSRNGRFRLGVYLGMVRRQFPSSSCDACFRLQQNNPGPRQYRRCGRSLCTSPCSCRRSLNDLPGSPAGASGDGKRTTPTVRLASRGRVNTACLSVVKPVKSGK